MIACMAMAVSLLIMRQLGGKWWLGILAGAIAAWAPLFKEIGVSAIGAIGLFVIAQPIFKHRTWKQTGVDIVLLLAGAAVSMAPLYIWIIGWKVQMGMPFYFVWDAVSGLIPKASAATQQAGSYVSSMRDVMPFSEQWPRVLRYYLALCLRSHWRLALSSRNRQNDFGFASPAAVVIYRAMLRPFPAPACCLVAA